MELAIVGSGVAGLVTAFLLHGRHRITLFEADQRIGGHVHTVRVEEDGRSVGVDTGFIVFNEWTYPNFIQLLDRLGVAWRHSDMSFSVRCDRTGLEYAGGRPGGLFAQRGNLLRPKFYRLLLEIARFYRRAGALAGSRVSERLTLGEFVAEERFSERFVQAHLVPLGSSIWSADPRGLMRFPAVCFARFLRNHGMLNLVRRPVWRTIVGGSARYVERLIAPFRGSIRTQCPVHAIERSAKDVEVRSAAGTERFDQVILATHSDQALRLLSDATSSEREVLGAIRYQANETVLHTDTSLLPARRRAWASWNYRAPREARPFATLTYNMNMLQGLETRETYCVTLNDIEQIDPRRILKRIAHHHPVYTPESVAAQRRRAEICGVNRTHFCGAYWGYGFHEDGVNSALTVARRFGAVL